MRRLSLVVVVFSLLLLAACGGQPAPVDDNTPAAGANGVAADQSPAPADAPADVLGVLAKASAAMDKLSGVTITGETESTSEGPGFADHETDAIEGEVTFKPFAQHYTVQSVSELDGAHEYESYITEEGMYMSDPETGGWMFIPFDDSNSLGAVFTAITQSQFEYFTTIADQFQLSRRDGDYVLTFTGEGDPFKEVAYGFMRDFAGDEAYERFTRLITDISGTYEFTVDPNTYYVKAVEFDFEETMVMMMTAVHMKSNTRLMYSDFNQVGAVTVPADVKENAQTLTMPDGFDFDFSDDMFDVE